MTDPLLTGNTSKTNELGPGTPGELNEFQRKAVEYRGGNLLIVAGPGTGKTHTITVRMAHLLASMPDDEGIIAITFTNKAAREVAGRIKKSTPSSGRILVGTFHQICLRFLKEYDKQQGIDDPAVLAGPERVRELVKQVYPDRSKRQINEWLTGISRYKAGGNYDDVPEEVSVYNTLLKKNGFYDFDDILVDTYRLFRSAPAYLERIRQKYRHVFVDEYQDVNNIQRLLLQYLTGPENAITAIGDPNQAIYGFRGSDVGYFERFRHDFNEVKVLTLSDNYRSSENLLSACAQVISKDNPFAVPPLTARLYMEGRLSIYEAATAKAEAEYVVHQVERLIGGTSMFSQDSGRVMTFEDSQVTFGDIAVLYRLHAQHHALRQAFDRAGIPYHLAVKPAEDAADEVCPSINQDIEVDCEKVSLMTLHASKGLEFPVVFIVGCEEDLIPLNIGRLTSDRREERRLFYVGMTRAKHRLYLLRSRRRSLFGKTYTTRPSDFITDIEEDLKYYEKNVLKPKGRRKQEQQIDLF